MILYPRDNPSYFGPLAYIGGMLSRSPRGRPFNAPAAFIHPCQPTVATEPPTGPGWAHELKHDGYRLQIHVRDGRVRLYTMNGADWSKRYPLVIQDAARIKGSAILDAEVVWLDANGVADFEALHSRSNDGRATALAFDLLMLGGEDMRRKPYVERKADTAVPSTLSLPIREVVSLVSAEVVVAMRCPPILWRYATCVEATRLDGFGCSQILCQKFKDAPKAPAATRAQDATF